MLAFENSNDFFLFTCWVSSSIRLEIRSLLVWWQSGPVSGHLAFLESGETGGPFFSPECSGTVSGGWQALQVHGRQGQEPLRTVPSLPTSWEQTPEASVPHRSQLEPVQRL